MSAQITQEYNQLQATGAIVGDKIPVADTSPAPVASPEPAAPAPTAAAVPAPAATPAPAVPFDKATHGLGKYNNLEELRKGYFNAVNALSPALDELSSLRALQQQAPVNPQQPFVAPTVPAGVPGGSPRVNPAARQPIDFKSDPEFAKLAEDGTVNVDLLVNVIDRIASTRAEEFVSEFDRTRIAPLQQMSEAENYMRAKYPDAANHVVEVGNFVKTNPQIGQAVASLVQAGSPAQAMEYAYTMYMANTGIGLENRMVANAQVAEEERQAARAAAGLPTSPNTGVLAAVPANNTPTAEDIAALNEAAGTGLSDTNAAIVRRRMLLGQMLPPELRTWERR